jgi:hypothetical protein
MKLTVSIAPAATAAAMLMLFGMRPAAAGVEFWLPNPTGVELGAPEFSNYLSPPGRGTCDWWTSAYLHACPTAIGPSTAPLPSPGPPPKTKKP